MSNLRESCERLKAIGFRVATQRNGEAKGVLDGDEVRDPWIVWQPEECLRYVEMPDHDRLVFLEIKMTFGGSTEFVDVQV